MSELVFKNFFSDYYKIVYYVNLANFGTMDEEQRGKFYDWLQKEVRNLYKKYEGHTICAGHYINDLVDSLTAYVVRKMDFDVAQERAKHGNGIKI